ncbi:alpha/beta fold hydrolase [uncultured Roseibium sp.]|uniref:alpha/beta hydrolase n=1 Tax=uncultured Roseibium sp. TaxID=1936171 RepID=UPI00262DDB24|nr:alpha/beta fold hydrolase [uncultured Roseibium sp.]
MRRMMPDPAFTAVTERLAPATFFTHLTSAAMVKVRRHALASLAVMCLLLVACAGGPAEFALYDPAPAQGSVVPILAITPRKPVDDPKLRYGDGRNSDLSYADIDVWVPDDRKLGTIKPPSHTPDPSSEFGVTGIDEVASESDALARINAQLKRLPPDDRIVMIFIHGYNVSYVSGIYRQAQLIHDFDQPVVGIHYSWPSAGKTSAYLYDRDSVQFARDGLQRTIELAARSNARTVAVVAHSMGTLLTMEAVRQLSLSNKKSALKRISPLVLASPDIDGDVFRSQISVIEPKPSPFVVLASRKDKALKISRDLRGGTSRIGQGDDIEALQELGITVVDLSEITDGQDGASHATFANSPTLIRLIQSGAISPASLPENREAFARRVGDGVADMLFLGN